jgi:putative peptidoglycan lipid II flippase
MAPGDTSTEVPKNVALQALSMALGTFSSRILGLLRDVALAALFRREVTDAWTAAFRLPNLFRRLLGEGALSVSFIPVYVEARVDSADRARNLANGFYTLLLLFLAAVTAVGIFAAEPLMRILLSANYPPEKFVLTVRMARIMFGFIFFITTYAYFTGILNALGKFALPALAPTLFNVAMIVSTLIPGSSFAHEGDGLAWGVLVGGFLQVAILVPALVKLGALPRFRDFRKNRDVHRVLRNLIPGLIGMGLLQFTTLVNLKYASGLGDGGISYIYWADRLLELPLSLVAVSLGSALLPTLSRLWQNGEQKLMADTANYYLRLTWFLAIPAGLGLFCLASPIVDVLFLRGHFTVTDAEATARVLRIYAVLLIFASGVRVLVPSYYAVKNAWFPAIVALFALALHVSLAPTLMHLWGLAGLAAAACTSTAINFLLLLAFYRRFMGDFDFKNFLKPVTKFLAAGVLLTVAVQVHPFLIEIFGTEFWARAMSLTLTVVLGATVYLIACQGLKVEELKSLRRPRPH